MHKAHDATLPPLAWHLEGLATFRRPSRAELDVDVIAGARRSGVRANGSHHGDALLVDDKHGITDWSRAVEAIDT